MPDCVGISENDNSCYADDTTIWAVAGDLASAKELLTESFAQFAQKPGLVLNPVKTQLMVGGIIKAKDLSSLSVKVNGIMVSPTKEIELLGVRFDTKFSTAPHDTNVATVARQRAGLIARLAHHLSRGKYLRQLARGLFIGTVGYAVAAAVPPRLNDWEASPSSAHKAVQVALNDLARTTTGKSRQDHVQIADLLHLAGIELAVRASVMETWVAFWSSDGKSGGRNPLGKLIFPLAPDASAGQTTTQSKSAGIVMPPLDQKADTLSTRQKYQILFHIWDHLELGYLTPGSVAIIMKDVYDILGLSSDYHHEAIELFGSLDTDGDCRIFEDDFVHGMMTNTKWVSRMETCNFCFPKEDTYLGQSAFWEL
eukprot:maker-scaffold220_size252247-snap-gene-1.24 protein:Tk01523 transcript:maker-scaffold220_size252247-snap-gene-1.24-mRNA-1 annotation:"conserved hypothetical protein"